MNASIRRNIVGSLTSILVLALAQPIAGASRAAAVVAGPGNGYCRYTVDLTGLASPHANLAKISQVAHVVCPFVAGEARDARVLLARANAPACAATDLPGFRIREATQLSSDAFGVEMGQCSAIHKPSPPVGAKAQGPVYVMTSSPKASIEIMQLVAASGLPASYVTAQGQTKQGAVYVCFEMLKGAKQTPLSVLREISPALASDLTQAKSAAPSCREALRQRGSTSERG